MLNAENGDEATIAIKPGEGDKKIAVVGGGIGTAPMYQVTRELAAAGVKPDVFSASGIPLTAWKSTAPSQMW